MSGTYYRHTIMASGILFELYRTQSEESSNVLGVSAHVNHFVTGTVVTKVNISQFRKYVVDIY